MVNTKYRYVFLIISCTLILGLILGIAIDKYKFFPYQLINYFHDALVPSSTEGLYSIGIYEGRTPFEMEPSNHASNPVLTANDVSDIQASFVADPFMVIDKQNYTMFFEVFNKETNQGDIGYAQSDDGYSWAYQNIVLDEPFHVSYPYVFKWEDEYYMTVESVADGSVRLYKANNFPEGWTFVKNLLEGYYYLDPSIFRFNNTWWLFVGRGRNDILDLYYSESLTGEWQPHPMNPIISLNGNIARPGGRVIVYDDHIYRFTQDDKPNYGLQVFAFKITELTKATYRESIVDQQAIISMSHKGWNAAGMHHIDAHKLQKGRWIASVDGRRR